MTIRHIQMGKRIYERYGPIQLAISMIFFIDSILLGSRFKTQYHPRLREYRYRWKYGSSSPIPENLVYINPDEVDYLVVPRQHIRADITKYGTSIIGGDWDLRYSDNELHYLGTWEGFQEEILINFLNYQFYTSAYERYKNGIAWEDTQIYEYFLQKTKERRNDKRYGTIEKVNERLKELDELYKSINDNGYRLQVEIERADEVPFQNTSDEFQTEPWQNEVMVSIGRDGEIFFNEGRHRFVAAKLAAIDEIPVRILVRHKGWQAIRQRVANANSITDLDPDLQNVIGHPDLVDLIPNMGD